MNPKNNILIVGGTGFIGYHLAKKALQKNWKVTSISSRPPKKLRYEAFSNLPVSEIKVVIIGQDPLQATLQHHYSLIHENRVDIVISFIDLRKPCFDPAQHGFLRYYRYYTI